MAPRRKTKLQNGSTTKEEEEIVADQCEVTPAKRGRKASQNKVNDKSSKNDTNTNQKSSKKKQNIPKDIASAKKGTGKEEKLTNKNIKEKKNSGVKNNDSNCDISEADMKFGNVVFKVGNFVRATVVNRPSKVIKSPYMADILVPGVDESQLCHSPALGCCGLIIPGAKVLVTPKSSSSAKSKYSLDLVDLGTTIVGANPMFCNKMVHTALLQGWVQGLPKFEKGQIKSEFTIEESRFDFKCEKNDITYYIEVKGVPNAALRDPPEKPVKKGKKKAGDVADVENGNDKISNSSLISFFPDGYRKNVGDAISPRALKHVHHLQKLTQSDTKGKTVCALVFVIQRSDCRIFQPTKSDPIYREAVYCAQQAGVLILPHVVTWHPSGQAVWNSTCLPSNLKDDTDLF